MNWASINWYPHHRRSAELGSALEAEIHFFPGSGRLLPLRYIGQWRDTRRVLREGNIDVLLVMQPPAIALASIATSWRLRSAIIVGDLHTGVFTDPKWKWLAPIVLRTLRRRGFAVVPNEELAGIVRRAGVTVFVTHAFIKPTIGPSAPRREGHILVPLSYSRDEPVDAIISAASMLNSEQFVLTGNPPSRFRDSAPPNVRFPGFVSAAEYQQLRAKARMVIALTEQEMTMQSAGFEALADATPLVTSPRRVLREFFGEAAVYAESDGRAIAASIETVSGDLPAYAERMKRRRDQQIKEQNAVIDAIRAEAENLAASAQGSL